MLTMQNQIYAMLVNNEKLLLRIKIKCFTDCMIFTWMPLSHGFWCKQKVSNIIQAAFFSKGIVFLQKEVVSIRSSVCIRCHFSSCLQFSADWDCFEAYFIKWLGMNWHSALKMFLKSFFVSVKYVIFFLSIFTMYFVWITYWWFFFWLIDNLI